MVFAWPLVSNYLFQVFFFCIQYLYWLLNYALVAFKYFFKLCFGSTCSILAKTFLQKWIKTSWVKLLWIEGIKEDRLIPNTFILSIWEITPWKLSLAPRRFQVKLPTSYLRFIWFKNKDDLEILVIYCVYAETKVKEWDESWITSTSVMAL